VIKAKKDYDAKKLSKQEVNKVRREAREFVRMMMSVLDRKRVEKYSKFKIPFNYGKKQGELVLLEKVAFVVKDTSKREEVFIGQISKDGMMVNVKKSNVNEFEKYLKDVKLPHNRLIKPQFFEAVKDIVGEEIELIWKV